ncbi:hypothetical protein FRC09_018527, partial [Ceratobasidium sp. 395]
MPALVHQTHQHAPETQGRRTLRLIALTSIRSTTHASHQSIRLGPPTTPLGSLSH